ncbi:MAG: hypothetical protein ACI4TX_02680 [Christensenellales bacterium]
MGDVAFLIAFSIFIVVAFAICSVITVMNLKKLRKIELEHLKRQTDVDILKCDKSIVEFYSFNHNQFMIDFKDDSGLRVWSVLEDEDGELVIKNPNFNVETVEELLKNIKDIYEVESKLIPYENLQASIATFREKFNSVPDIEVVISEKDCEFKDEIIVAPFSTELFYQLSMKGIEVENFDLVKSEVLNKKPKLIDKTISRHTNNRVSYIYLYDDYIASDIAFVSKKEVNEISLGLELGNNKRIKFYKIETPMVQFKVMYNDNNKRILEKHFDKSLFVCEDVPDDEIMNIVLGQFKKN